MKAPLKLTLKVDLNIFFVLLFAFSLLSTNFIALHNFASIYLEEIFEDVQNIEDFTAKTSNAARVGVFCPLVFIVPILDVGRILQYTPNPATLSRAPPSF